jgi:hypothetical protein
MLKKVSDEIAQCYAHAAVCREKAATVADPALKADFLEVERSWLFLARSLEFTERLDTYCEETHRERESASPSSGH